MEVLLKDGLKLLIYSFAFAAIVCVLGCWYDNCHPKFRPMYAHVEIHGHRPLDESIREEAKDRERREMSKDERDYRDAQDRGREQEQNTDFGSMT